MKVLIFNTKTNALYSKFKEEFPKCDLFLVNSFNINSNENSSIKDNDLSTNIFHLDLFNGSILTDFLMKHGRFDLIVLIIDFNKKNFIRKKLKNSILFLYKHFLGKEGFFFIVFHDNELYNYFLKNFSKSKFKNSLLKTWKKQQNNLSPSNLIIFKKSNFYGEN